MYDLFIIDFESVANFQHTAVNENTEVTRKSHDQELLTIELPLTTDLDSWMEEESWIKESQEESSIKVDKHSSEIYSCFIGGVYSLMKYIHWWSCWSQENLKQLAIDL